MVKNLSQNVEVLEELKKKYFFNEETLEFFEMLIDYDEDFSGDINIRDYFYEEHCQEFKDKGLESFGTEDWLIASKDYLDNLEKLLEIEDFKEFLEEEGIFYENLKDSDFCISGCMIGNKTMTEIYEFCFILNYNNKVYIHSEYDYLEGKETVRCFYKRILNQEE